MPEWEYIVTCVRNMMEDSAKWGYWLDTVTVKKHKPSLHNDERRGYDKDMENSIENETTEIVKCVLRFRIYARMYASVCVCVLCMCRVYIKTVINSNRNNALCEQ